ncbi:MAG: uroporphyrinogen-III synthase [Acidobacteriia bacterium]|nr:uroporphyrinogen-III synthase [Terriglobia bacterium]
MRKPSEKHPLAGTRILVGRARHQASSLSAGLRSLGAAVIEIPFIEIRKPQSYRPLDDALKNIRNYDWLILTSANGVEAMWERWRKLRIPRRALQHLQIAAIGPATKKAIVKHGLKVKMVPEEYVAESVVKGLRDEVKGKRVVLIRAKVARDVIPEELRTAGAEVDVVEAYETVVPEKSRARLRALMKNASRRPHIVTFTSSSSARNFSELLGKVKAGSLGARLFQHLQFASIGPVTSATLRDLQMLPAIEAREFTMAGLIRAIVLARYAETASIEVLNH